MWGTILEAIRKFFTRPDERRADFVAVTHQWESIAGSLKEQLEGLREFTLKMGRRHTREIKELQEECQRVKKEADSCKEERESDRALLLDLQARIRDLESK